jgi:hypothetical protein
MPPKAAAAAKNSTSTTAIEQRSLGVDRQTFVTDVRDGFGKSKAPRQVTRQALYLDEEEDFNADLHPVSMAEKLRIQQADLEDARELHVDAGEELGDGDGDLDRMGMPEESPANIAQWKADMADPTGLRARIKTKARVGSTRTAKQVERANIARTGTHNEDLVRARMQQVSVPAFQRLGAAQALARAERQKLLTEMKEKEQGAPERGPLDDEAHRARRKIEREAFLLQYLKTPLTKTFVPPDPEPVTLAELSAMLVVNPFGELSKKLQVGLMELGDMFAVVCRLQSLMWEDEFEKRHFNTIEVLEMMVEVGAKFVDMTRRKINARLALALDAEHYGAYIYRSKEQPNDVALLGGHEHFDERANETSLIVFEFRCVRRTKENNANKVAQRAKRALGTDLGDDFQRELQPVNTRTENIDDEDEANIYDDRDDSYQSGNDIADPERTHIYKISLVFIEDTHAQHPNETSTSGAPDEAAATTTAKSNDDDDNDKMATDNKDDSGSESFDIFAQPVEPEKEPDAAAAAAPEPPKEIDQLDDFKYNGGIEDDADDDEDEDKALPTGEMHITYEKAKALVGKWRANMLIGWLNGARRPKPLCFRSYNISI